MTQTNKWDQVLLDIERRAEEIRQIKPNDGLTRGNDRLFAIAAMVLGAAIFAAGGLVGGLVVRCAGH